MHVSRLPQNPMITLDMHESLDGNINGPSLIRVPSWVRKPLGRYYLYFAHHGGKFIRLAYADALAGPWRIHEPGSLRLEQTPYGHHIASPDVHVDEANKRIIMYYHGCCVKDHAYGQTTMAATSADGLHFESRTEHLDSSYWRMWQYGEWYYAVVMPFQAGDGGMKILRSRDPLTGWERSPRRYFTEDWRHGAVKLDGDVLTLFWSDAFRRPERLMFSRMDLRGDWLDWQPTTPQTLLRPEMPWEGADAPHTTSKRGAVHGCVWQLRDPGIYREDGRDYLLYAAGGEHAIAIAELHDPQAGRLPRRRAART
jgi:hypothetical protein